MIYASTADALFRVFQDVLSALARRRQSWGSRPPCSERGPSLCLNPYSCLLSPCPHHPQVHGSTPSCTSHVLLSSFIKFPAQPHILPSSLPSSGQAKQPHAPRSIAQPDRTAQTEISKESPSKSSSCPMSRQVSLPPPQIKGTDVKLMPHLITTKKPRGLQTFIHLELQARLVLANQIITPLLPQHEKQPGSVKVSFLHGTLLRAGLGDLQEVSSLLRGGAGDVGLDSGGSGPGLKLPARDEWL